MVVEGENPLVVIDLGVEPEQALRRGAVGGERGAELWLEDEVERGSVLLERDEVGRAAAAEVAEGSGAPAAAVPVPRAGEAPRAVPVSEGCRLGPGNEVRVRVPVVIGEVRRPARQEVAGEFRDALEARAAQVSIDLVRHPFRGVVAAEAEDELREGVAIEVGGVDRRGSAQRFVEQRPRLAEGLAVERACGELVGRGSGEILDDEQLGAPVPVDVSGGDLVPAAQDRERVGEAWYALLDDERRERCVPRAPGQPQDQLEVAVSIEVGRQRAPVLCAERPRPERLESLGPTSERDVKLGDAIAPGHDIEPPVAVDVAHHGAVVTRWELHRTQRGEVALFVGVQDVEPLPRYGHELVVAVAVVVVRGERAVPRDTLRGAEHARVVITALAEPEEARRTRTLVVNEQVVRPVEVEVARAVDVESAANGDRRHSALQIAEVERGAAVVAVRDVVAPVPIGVEHEGRAPGFPGEPGRPKRDGGAALAALDGVDRDALDPEVVVMEQQLRAAVAVEVRRGDPVRHQRVPAKKVRRAEWVLGVAPQPEDLLAGVAVRDHDVVAAVLVPVDDHRVALADAERPAVQGAPAGAAVELVYGEGHVVVPERAGVDKERELLALAASERAELRVEEARARHVGGGALFEAPSGSREEWNQREELA